MGLQLKISIILTTYKYNNKIISEGHVMRWRLKKKLCGEGQGDLRGGWAPLLKTVQNMKGVLSNCIIQMTDDIIQLSAFIV